MGKRSLRPKSNYFFSVLSIALLLFIILVVGVAWVHSNAMIKELKENLNLVIELDNQIEDGAVADIERALHKMPETISSSYAFLSKEEAFETMSAEFGEDFLSSEFPNPLHDVITINIKQEYMTSDHLKAIKSKVAAVSSEISGVYFEDSFLNGSMENLKRAGIVFLVAVFVMLAVVLTLLHSTVKLSLFSNRFLIKNMELVGAKASFIMAPFIKRSVVHGFVSSLIAIALAFGLAYYVKHTFPNVLATADWLGLSIVIGMTVLLGILITSVSTALIVRRYLRAKLNDLF